jgi:hypothetical protein
MWSKCLFAIWRSSLQDEPAASSRSFRFVLIGRSLCSHLSSLLLKAWERHTYEALALMLIHCIFESSYALLLQLPSATAGIQTLIQTASQHSLPERVRRELLRTACGQPYSSCKDGRHNPNIPLTAPLDGQL